MQQIVGIDDTFHQDIRPTFADNAHGLAGSLIGIFYVQGMYILRILLQGRISLQHGSVANHQKFGNSLLQRASDSILRIRVIGAYHCNTFPLVQGLQVRSQLIKASNGFHNVRFLANI